MSFLGYYINGDCDIVASNCCHNPHALVWAYNCNILVSALYLVVNYLNLISVFLFFDAIVSVKKSLGNLGGEWTNEVIQKKSG